MLSLSAHMSYAIGFSSICHEEEILLLETLIRKNIKVFLKFLIYNFSKIMLERESAIIDMYLIDSTDVSQNHS